MGQGESTLSMLEGLQVSRVHHASPAFEAGLVPYFDFIVAVDTVALDSDNYSFFYDYVKKNEGRPIKLRVFNLRIRVEREVIVTPRDWSGNKANGILGFNVSWESADKAVEATWHITNVVPGSPAHRAELMATRDYLLGMQMPADFSTLTVFKDSSEFHTRLEEWRMVQEAIAIQKPGTKGSLLLLVFDSMANQLKEIIVETATPDESLGIEVANGYLHVVPPTPGSHALPRLTRCVVTRPPVQNHQQQHQHQQPQAASAGEQQQAQQQAPPQQPPPTHTTAAAFPAPPTGHATLPSFPVPPAPAKSPAVAPAKSPATATAAPAVNASSSLPTLPSMPPLPTQQQHQQQQQRPSPPPSLPPFPAALPPFPGVPMQQHPH